MKEHGLHRTVIKEEVSVLMQEFLFYKFWFFCRHTFTKRGAFNLSVKLERETKNRFVIQCQQEGFLIKQESPHVVCSGNLGEQERKSHLETFF